jgi:DNA-binding XRE family transcriptional regulator
MTHALKSYRETNKLSKSELARQLGVSRFTIIRWENGDRKIDRNLLTDVAKATGIAPKDLRPDLAELIGES